MEQSLDSRKKGIRIWSVNFQREAKIVFPTMRTETIGSLTQQMNFELYLARHTIINQNGLETSMYHLQP